MANAWRSTALASSAAEQLPPPACPRSWNGIDHAVAASVARVDSCVQSLPALCEQPKLSDRAVDQTNVDVGGSDVGGGLDGVLQHSSRRSEWGRGDPSIADGGDAFAHRGPERRTRCARTAVGNRAVTE